jgi:FkbM family methyltransferase
MKKKIKQTFLKLMSLFIERRTNYPLQYFAQLRAENIFFQVPAKDIEEILGDQKIVMVDVGARGGLEKDMERYLDSLDITLCEADPLEAARLKTLGYARVFDCIVGSSESKQKSLTIGAHPGTSSCLKLNSNYLDFYCSGATQRFTPVTEIMRPSVSLISLLEDSIDNIDYLKIDTQGSELEVLQGLGQYRPIIIKCEVSYVPLYEESALIHDIQKYLFDLGYILFHVSSVMRSAPLKHKSSRPFDRTVIPLHGDAYFMPDWTRWRSVVGERQRKYEALMHIFGLEDVYNYAMLTEAKP